MAPPSSSRSASSTPQSIVGNPRTPSSTSKHKPVSLISRFVTPSTGFLQPSPSSSEHPVEVIGRIREHPEGPDKASALQILPNGQTVRVRSDQGYRDFALDGISLAQHEDLNSFYKKYVEGRIESVKLGGRCTIMMYGPTGSGKSHTMFGSAKEPGIAYRALQNILGEKCGSLEEKNAKPPTAVSSPDSSSKKFRVTVRILEIYNEDIFDLLATCYNTSASHWNKSRTRLEIMGKKAKNTMSISGTDADQISKEIAKVEKRRIVKSTTCNERSSRSHCLVMLDVPTIGGRLVLVDMAGSENLEQAGLGMDSKMQTGKINQGNIALKRVVEAIANGDSYIPFRDSKLTMLLQDSFEDDGAKILMVLCASPDPRDLYKTIGTLEYGCKAKCIVRLPISPAKEKSGGVDSAALDARIRAMEMYISKLEAENQNKEKEKEDAMKALASLKEELARREEEARDGCTKCCKFLKMEMETKIRERERLAEELIEAERQKLEEKERMLEMLHSKMKSRMEEFEREIELLREKIPAASEAEQAPHMTDYQITGKRGDFLENFRAVAASKQAGNFADDVARTDPSDNASTFEFTDMAGSNRHEVASQDGTSDSSPFSSSGFAGEHHHQIYELNGWMPAIPEEPEEEAVVMADDDEFGSGTSQGMTHSREIEPESVDRNPSSHPTMEADCTTMSATKINNYAHLNSNVCFTPTSEGDVTPVVNAAASRRSRIENIFLLCGNHRELAAQKYHTTTTTTPVQANHTPRQAENQLTSTSDHSHSHGQFTPVSQSPAPNVSAVSPETLNLTGTKSTVERCSGQSSFPKPRHPLSENTPPQADLPQGYSSPSPIIGKSPLQPLHSTIQETATESAELLDADKCEVYVKWETSKESSGKLIDTIRIRRDANLAELRKELEERLSEDVKQEFVFLMLGDPSGSPVDKEEEKAVVVASLPDCHRQKGSKLACLRPRPQAKWNMTAAILHSPLRSMENQMINRTAGVVKSSTPSLLHHASLNNSNGKLQYERDAETTTAELKQQQSNCSPLISHMKGLRM